MFNLFPTTLHSLPITSILSGVKSDEKHIMRCLELARKGGALVAPNPMVGCVITHNEDVISEGFHECFGAPHAEANALSAITDLSVLPHCTLYVNLEPCTHTGNTPPCCDLIIQHRVGKVVIGARDPNPTVAGGGVEKLVNAGIEVACGVAEKDCHELNRRFETYCGLKRPYIILKWAQTKDGFIARDDGSSKWISSNQSRALVHQWRSQESAIMVGTHTAKIDNPRLTSRLDDFDTNSADLTQHNPYRVVLDRTGGLSTSLHLFNEEAPTLVVTENEAASFPNANILCTPFNSDLLKSVVSALHEQHIISLLVEGGATLLQSFIDSDLWDEARVFESTSSFGTGVAAPVISAAQAVHTLQIDTDILTTYRPEQSS